MPSIRLVSTDRIHGAAGRSAAGGSGTRLTGREPSICSSRTQERTWLRYRPGCPTSRWCSVPTSSQPVFPERRAATSKWATVSRRPRRRCGHRGAGPSGDIRARLASCSSGRNAFKSGRVLGQVDRPVRGPVCGTRRSEDRDDAVPWRKRANAASDDHDRTS